MKSGLAVQPLAATAKRNRTAGEGPFVADGGGALHTSTPRTRFIESVVRRTGAAGDKGTLSPTVIS